MKLPEVEYLRTRTYLKVQDGCDSFCSYCIIPFARKSKECGGRKILSLASRRIEGF